jgi:uncharacterized membrane protein
MAQRVHESVEVRMTDRDTSHWRVKGPLGKSVKFNARTTERDPTPPRP